MTPRSLPHSLGPENRSTISGSISDGVSAF
jgi:hypothetical protein